MSPEPALTPVRDAFHEPPDARPLACGIIAHPVDPTHIEPARASLLDRHDRINGARHTGWYADTGQVETLTGFVYVLEPDVPYSGPVTYYAVAVSDATDCHYVDPDAYDDPVAAANAADRMAELITELDRQCDRLRTFAADARRRLAEGNRARREALDILRHLRTSPADGDVLGPAFTHLWRQSADHRRRAFELIDQHRPFPRWQPFDATRTPTAAQCHAGAWRDGWNSGAEE